MDKNAEIAAVTRSVPRRDPLPEAHRRPLSALPIAIVSACLILLGVLVVVGSATGWFRIDDEMSNSMSPAIRAGDAVIVSPEPTSAVRVGQTIAFRPPHPYPQVTVIHRVVEVRRVDGVTVIRTRGIANHTDDPWLAVLPKGDTWHVVAVIPWVGRIASFARNGIVQILVLLAIVIALSSMAGRLFASARHHETDG